MYEISPIPTNVVSDGPVFLDFACMISKNISLFSHLQVSFICFNINHLDFSL